MQPTLRQRWYHLRTSPRFPFVVFLGLLLAGGLSQVYYYWWGVRLQQMLARYDGHAERNEVFPQWVKRYLGARFVRPLEPIRSVHFTSARSANRDIAANDLRLLRGSLFLRELHLNGRLSPEACRHLACLTQLRTVQLWETSDSIIDALAKLPRLTSLSLPFDKLTDPSDYERLARMPHLERLGFWWKDRLRGRPNIASCLRELSKSRSLLRLNGRLENNEQLLALTSLHLNGSPPLPELRELRIGWSKGLTKRGLLSLRHLPSLIHLDVSDSDITDDELAQLKGLPFLRTLYLEGNPDITDEGVSILAEMHKLESLNVKRTNITREGVLRLAALPRLRCLRESYAGPEMQAQLRQILPAGCELDTN